MVREREPATRQQDAVDGVLRQWAAVRPDLDSTPIAVVGRVSRLARLIDARLGENFARFGIDDWMYDVLATLRRGGEPYELAAGELGRQTMITTGAMTNRIDRLEQRGFVQRVAAADRRKVIVRLTAAGLQLVDDIVESHLATERAILAPLRTAERENLAAQLRALLVALGDRGPDRDGVT